LASGAGTDRVNASFVVIVRNGETTIRQCLDSLICQTRNAEIIVVDGNSTDRTREIASLYPTKLVFAPKQDSYGISRNVGVRQARGRIILFMDADDVASPTHCEKLVEHFEDPSVGIVNVPRVASQANGWFLKMLQIEWSAAPAEGSEPYQTDWRTVTTKGSAFLREAIVKAGWFDENMFFGTEDKELAYRIQKLGYRVLHDPAAVISAKPVKGAWDFVKDKFARAGMGHGYFRKKHGRYRPPLGGIASLILLALAIDLYFVQPVLTLMMTIGEVLTLHGLLREGFSLYSQSKSLKLALAFVVMKWLSRIVEFLGFVLGYVIPMRVLRRL
jgi:glycosyltransferase involved in cell wall biosynthesis